MRSCDGYSERWQNSKHSEQVMDFKDFKKIIKQRTKSAFSLVQSTYAAKQRESRPRVKKDILRDKT